MRQKSVHPESPSAQIVKNIRRGVARSSRLFSRIWISPGKVVLRPRLAAAAYIFMTPVYLELVRLTFARSGKS